MNSVCASPTYKELKFCLISGRQYRFEERYGEDVLEKDEVLLKAGGKTFEKKGTVDGVDEVRFGSTEYTGFCCCVPSELNLRDTD